MKKRVSSVHFFFLLFLAILFIPIMVRSDYVIHVINMIGLMTILTLSLNLLFGYTGQISLGHAGFYGVGAYVSTLLEMNYGMTFVPSLLIAASTCWCIAVVVGVPTLRLKEHYLALATLGFTMVVYLIVNNWQPVTGGATGIAGIPRPRLFGEALTESEYYYIIWVIAFGSLLFCHNLMQSHFGYALLAIRENEDAASSLGVNVTLVKIVIFAVTAIMAGVAGALYAHLNQYINPINFSLNLSISVLLAVVIGGLGSNLGAVVGAIVVTIIPEFLYEFQSLNMLVYGAIVAVIVRFFPKGIVGGLKELRLSGRLFASTGLITPSVTEVSKGREV